MLSRFMFTFAPHCVGRAAHRICVILRHCFKSGCFAPLFLPERLKIETFMLSECTFPPGSVQLWVCDIGYTPSRGICFPGCHWLAPVGLCEEKLFWQDPGAQRSCWKLGEGQCRWNQESSGGAQEMASPWLWAPRCWDVTSQLQQRAGIQREDHMAGEVQRRMNEGWEWTMICSNDSQRARVRIIWVQLTLKFVVFRSFGCQKLHIYPVGLIPWSDGLKYIWPHTYKCGDFINNTWI